MTRIHPTAVVDPKAQLASEVTVGPYAVIGPKVKIDAGTVVHSHAVVEGNTRVGKNNIIYSFAAVGGIPQDKKYRGEDTRLIIGDGNTIREYCTLNIGTVTGIGETRVGDDNWIMAYTHIAHDCVVGSHTILANNTGLAGHVTIKDWVITGGYTLVLQFCQIGEHAMTAFSSRVDKDIPPYVMAAGFKLKPVGINAEGLRRRHFSAAEMAHIKEAYHILYRENLTLEEAKKKLAPLIAAYPELKFYQTFFADSERSILR